MEMLSRFPRAKYLIVALPWFVGLIWNVHSYIQSVHVSQRERTASGIVMWHEPQNHNTYHYSFEVGGKRYLGGGSPGGCAPSSMRIGQIVRVYYDPANPNESGLCTFKEQGQSVIAVAAWLVAGIVLVGLFVFEKKAAIRSD